MEGAIVSLVLSGHGRDALKVGFGLLLAIAVALAFAIASLLALFGIFFGADGPSGNPSGADLEEIPADQLPVIQQAAATCGLPWPVLAAVARVESDFGQNMATSSAGAIGYGQFLPGTWAAYGQGGNPYDYHEALPAMAHYLCDHGGTNGTDLRGALFAYDHADWYVAEVLALATRYGYLAPGSGPSRIVELARAQLGMPYVWGGASPRTSFDCSGLVQWVYGQVGVGLPRTAQQQFDATTHIANDQLSPGDLVFFQATYPSSDPITHVGIYIGDGLMINAPSEGETVSIMPVFTGFWGAHYAGAGRVGG